MTGLRSDIIVWSFIACAWAMCIMVGWYLAGDSTVGLVMAITWHLLTLSLTQATSEPVA